MKEERREEAEGEKEEDMQTSSASSCNENRVAVL